jgi:hypothetical protein
VIVTNGPVKDWEVGVLIITVPVGSPLAGARVTVVKVPSYGLTIVVYGPEKALEAGVFIKTVPVGVGSSLAGSSVTTDIEVPV